ncbi:hypothetical protein HXY33_03535 [Candidatus Bathyarchaeota archaeon]|nr:hypothetical protein [Candidatus Bathyarchaeota archaeon]
MRKRQRQLLLVFSIILVLSGLILTASSSIYTSENEATVEENGVSYSLSKSDQEITFGTEIKRYFSLGEEMTVTFTHAFTPPYNDLLPPINFTIQSPSNKTTIFWYWLEPYDTDEDTIIVKTNLTVSKVDGLKRTNSSSDLDFAGEALEDGTYTLIFTTLYNTKLSYLAFVKIITTYDYPYTHLLPLGATIMVTGTILLIVSSKFGRKIKKNV